MNLLIHQHKPALDSLTTAIDAVRNRSGNTDSENDLNIPKLLQAISDSLIVGVDLLTHKKSLEADKKRLQGKWKEFQGLRDAFEKNHSNSEEWKKSWGESYDVTTMNKHIEDGLKKVETAIEKADELLEQAKDPYNEALKVLSSFVQNHPSQWRRILEENEDARKNWEKLSQNPEIQKIPAFKDIITFMQDHEINAFLEEDRQKIARGIGWVSHTWPGDHQY